MANLTTIKSIINYIPSKHKVIAFSLWGSDKKYLNGAVANIELAKKYYPDWICRFYIGSDVSPESDVVQSIKKYDNVSIYLMEYPGSWNGMFWRFLPISDQNVERFISRDLDSRIGEREVAAVNEWIASGKIGHIMRDHPYHTSLIMGGMWGAVGGHIHNIEECILSFNKDDKYDVDQKFLNHHVFPLFCAVGYMVHDPFFNRAPFPTERKNFEFVGEIILEDGSRKNADVTALIRHVKRHGEATRENVAQD